MVIPARIWLLEKVNSKVVSSGSLTIAEIGVRKPMGSSSLKTRGGKSTVGGSLTTFMASVFELRISRSPLMPPDSSSAKRRICSSSMEVL